jgi:hypothetical protein
MNILQTLRLCHRIIKLEVKLLRKLQQSIDPLTLEKDFELLKVLLARFILDINVVLNDKRIASGTAVDNKPAPTVSMPCIKRA